MTTSVWSAHPLALPETLADRLAPGQAAQLAAIGNPALLETPLLGLLASRACPGHVLLQTLDRVPDWVQAERVILSGFHSPLEQQILRSVLRRQGRAVKILARSLANYRPAAEEQEPLTAGRLLILTACPPAARRTTRATALERNRLVLALATEVITPQVADNSPLAALPHPRLTTRR